MAEAFGKIESMAQFYALRQKVLDATQDNGSTWFSIQLDLLHSGDSRNAALSAWIDIMPEHQGNIKQFPKIFQALFPKVANTRIKQPEPSFDRLQTIEKALKHQFPSVFEKTGRRKSFAHLLNILEASGNFGDDDYQDIADMLFDPYMIIDGGAQMNLSFPRMAIEKRGLDDEDFYDSMNYPILKAVKEGKNVQFQYNLDGMVKDKRAIEKIKQEVYETQGSASMWTGLQHPSDGDTEGMEVVIVTGNMDDRDDRTVVGRWVYESKDENGNQVWIPLRYNQEQSIRTLSAYKRGNFMDIDNQGFIKESVQRWIEEGASGLYDSIPSFMEEFITAEYQPFNIGKFELNEVVIPFWEKYKHLSDSEFAAQWEEDRIQTTYTFEEKFHNVHAILSLFDPYRPSIGAIRYGGGRYQKTNEPLGRRAVERDRRNVEKEFLLEATPDRGETGAEMLSRTFNRLNPL